MIEITNLLVQLRFVQRVMLTAFILLAACGRETPATPIPTPTPTPVLSDETTDRTGQLLKSDGPAIYRLMEDGSLRHIPTWADYVALGFEDADVIALTDAELAGYALGPPLTADASFTPEIEERDPLHSVTDLVLDPLTGTLWFGTAFAGVYACPWLDERLPELTDIAARVKRDTCRVHTTFSSDLLDNTIHALVVDANSRLWAASPGGVTRYVDDEWQAIPLATGATTRGALALALTADNTLWVGGDGYIAQGTVDGGWRVHTAIDQPLLDDAFAVVTVSSSGEVVFAGNKRQLRFDGVKWRAHALDGSSFIEFQPDPQPLQNVTPPPLTFPDPRTDYQVWLQSWPRPQEDNGRCLHFVQAAWLDVEQAQLHIDRLTALGVRWTVVPYANHFQLRRLAPLFAQAGITVVWRPFVRPYEAYTWWREDVIYLRTHGYAPYMQLYNEPSLAQEWDAPHTEDDPSIDQATYLDQLMPAMRTVYDAGGYIGLQHLSLDWSRATLRHLQAVGLTDTFDRLFFVPHPYGLNHPPAYDEDESSVLGFRAFAQLFMEEIGFVPMMVAGEGGWRPGEQQDDRYPPVSAENHQEYHVAVYEWFRNGELSNGEPLPDYLFAFCPWLIADPVDPAAWYDSQSGDRTPTIEAVQALLPFVRRFSWD